MPELKLYSVSKLDDYCLVVRARSASRAVTLARHYDPSPNDEDRRSHFEPHRMRDDYAPATEGEAVWDLWDCDECDEAHIDLNGWYDRRCVRCERGTITFGPPTFGALSSALATP
jgi:hypothetical protein